jgi:hypothetical protein
MYNVSVCFLNLSLRFSHLTPYKEVSDVAKALVQVLHKTIWNKEFEKLKIGIDVFDLSCREFFSGQFKSQDFFFEIFFQKNWFYGQIFDILQGVLANPYEELER